MNFVRYYFICGIILNCIGLFGMNFEKAKEECFQQVRDQIDEQLLGINKDAYFRSLRGAFASYYKSWSLTKEKAEQDLQQIEPYITTEDKAAVLKKLLKKHWYAYYAMTLMINEKAKDCKNVKGSTIDVINNPSDVNTLKKFIHKRALLQMNREARIDNHIMNVPMCNGCFFYQSSKFNTRFAILYGHNTDIYSNSLRMSRDGKYLLSKDVNDIKIIWDMNKGEKVDLLEEEEKNIEWIRGYSRNHKYHVISDNYYASSANSGVSVGENHPQCPSFFDIGNPNNIPVYIDRKHGIVLFKRPTQFSNLCEIAFYNSQRDREELNALNNSRTLQDVEGFPQNNIKNLIQERLSKL